MRVQATLIRRTNERAHLDPILGEFIIRFAVRVQVARDQRLQRRRVVHAHAPIVETDGQVPAVGRKGHGARTTLLGGRDRGGIKFASIRTIRREEI